MYLMRKSFFFRVTDETHFFWSKISIMRDRRKTESVKNWNNDIQRIREQVLRHKSKVKSIELNNQTLRINFFCLEIKRKIKKSKWIRNAHTHTQYLFMRRDLVYRHSVDSKTLIPFESTLNCFGRLIAATFFILFNEKTFFFTKRTCWNIPL